MVGGVSSGKTRLISSNTDIGSVGINKDSMKRPFTEKEIMVLSAMVDKCVHNGMYPTAQILNDVVRKIKSTMSDTWVDQVLAQLKLDEEGQNGPDMEGS